MQTFPAPVRANPLGELRRVHLRHRYGQFRGCVLVHINVIRDLGRLDVRVVRLEHVGGGLVEVRVHRQLSADDALQHLQGIRFKAVPAREETHPQQRGHASRNVEDSLLHPQPPIGL